MYYYFNIKKLFLVSNDGNEINYFFIHLVYCGYDHLEFYIFLFSLRV